VNTGQQASADNTTQGVLMDPEALGGLADGEKLGHGPLAFRRLARIRSSDVAASRFLRSLSI